MPTVIIANRTNDNRGANISKSPAKMVQLSLGAPTIFTFPYAPVEVNFENLAAAYEETKRTAKWPTLNFSGYQLTKAALNFRLANRPSGGAFEIEDQLDQLRAMATVPFVVYFTGGVDRMLLQGVTGISGRFSAWWRITDMSVKVLTRDLNNKATQADITMTVTEERNPTIPITFLSPISYAVYPARKLPPQSGAGGGQTFTDVTIPEICKGSPDPKDC
jgi:hypothetical protein